MTISPDYLIERKQHKSQLKNWKILALIMLVIIMVVVSRQLFYKAELFSEYIASVYLTDAIIEDSRRDYTLSKIIDDKRVKALIVHINSPGSSVVGAEKVYNILRKVAKFKPVVAVMGTMATSGAYLISIGADYIFSHNGTITGSIGVIYTTAEITELAEKIGLSFHNFKSSALKAAPNFVEKITPTVADATMSGINDAYEYFVELVALRRGFSLEETKDIADGRVYTGRQALRLKLVDAIGDEDSAVKWLQDTKKINPALKVQIRELKPENRRILSTILGNFSNLVPSFLKNGRLNGLMAIF